MLYSILLESKGQNVKRLGGLFAIYLIGLLGPGIPGFSTVSRAWSGMKLIQSYGQFQAP